MTSEREMQDKIVKMREEEVAKNQHLIISRARAEELASRFFVKYFDFDMSDEEKEELVGKCLEAAMVFATPVWKISMTRTGQAPAGLSEAKGRPIVKTQPLKVVNPPAVKKTASGRAGAKAMVTKARR